MSMLDAIVAANRRGKPRGIPSWCTAHEPTLRAVLAAHRDDAEPILIESTCNQVNQDGGYTGMVPVAFAAFIRKLAGDEGVAPDRLVLGGDHLGPNPWKRQRAAEAMDKAKAMVAAYVEAGFEKIHLDASMACADDAMLSEQQMAARAGALCAAAEGTAGGRRLRYVIGTEVPVPGGEAAGSAAIAVTMPEAVRRTWALHQEAFAAQGLGEAFGQVLGVVVQPGVDFSNTEVMDFAPEGAETLSAALAAFPGVVYEAHSTDYQREDALRALVRGHFAILKVGPELTHAFFKAIAELVAIEAGRAPATPSNLIEVMRSEMRADPRHWRPYVAPGADAEREMFEGLSDRVRYYWARPSVAAALRRLFVNLADLAPDQVVRERVGAVVKRYRRASGA